ncbi:methionine synthase I, cobalamin-binding domain-containing protein [Candidatus Heimdallarchaeota archaeon B3_Heim]|nr:MAG: methionine synthase I, cobalamin-binding domain-containing protein [Candidatus Heimdallarchaeota archaeon B3_Heim]
MSFTQWLGNVSKIILFDGAMGTQLMNYNLEPGKLPDFLNIEGPEIVKKVLASYYESGADMVQTCTFSANLVNLERQHLSEYLQKINIEALRNIKDIQPPRGKLIVGDIGPSGEFRPPVGEASGDQWKNGFQQQVEVLEVGVDLWHIETMSDLQEMSAAIHAIKEVSLKPIIASMTYRKTKTRGFFTIMGDSLETCVNTLEEENVDVIGTNCTLGSDQMIELTKELVQLTDKPVSVKPNAGQPRLEGGITVYDQSPDEFVNDIEQMIDLGVKIVGGCCGTTPTHIQKMRMLIDNR